MGTASMPDTQRGNIHEDQPASKKKWIIVVYMCCEALQYILINFIMFGH